MVKRNKFAIYNIYVFVQCAMCMCNAWMNSRNDEFLMNLRKYTMYLLSTEIEGFSVDPEIFSQESIN